MFKTRIDIKKEEQSVLYWIRWLLVLPGALVFGFLVTFPFHWILQFVFGFRSNEPDLLSLSFILKILKIDSVDSLEYLLYPAIIAVTYIVVGQKIAPKHKFKTAVILFALYAVVWAVGLLVSLNTNFEISIRTFLALAGAILALYYVKDKQKIKRDVLS